MWAQLTSWGLPRLSHPSSAPCHGLALLCNLLSHQGQTGPTWAPGPAHLCTAVSSVSAPDSAATLSPVPPPRGCQPEETRGGGGEGSQKTEMEDLSRPGAGLFSPAASGPHPSWWRGEGVFRRVRTGSFIEGLSVCQALGGWEFQVSPTALSFKVNQRETPTHPPTSFAPFLCMQPWTFQTLPQQTLTPDLLIHAGHPRGLLS